MTTAANEATRTQKPTATLARFFGRPAPPRLRQALLSQSNLYLAFSRRMSGPAALSIRGVEVPITSEPGVDVACALESVPFRYVALIKSGILARSLDDSLWSELSVGIALSSPNVFSGSACPLSVMFPCYLMYK